MNMVWHLFNIMSAITNPTTINRSDLFALLDLEKKPVIFWDTCAFIDIIRLPLPERKYTSDILERLILIKNKIVSGDIISISSNFCIREFNDNVTRYINHLKTETQRLNKEHNDFISFINKANLGSNILPNIDLSIHNLEVLLSNITLEITSRTKFVNDDPSYSAFAEFRVRNHIPPAKKKGEYKDCYIWATCLDIRKNCTDKTHPYYFLSSNTKDYAATNKSEFVMEIKTEADINNITYSSNFDLIFGRLRGAGLI